MPRLRRVRDGGEREGGAESSLGCSCQPSTFHGIKMDLLSLILWPRLDLKWLCSSRTLSCLSAAISGIGQHTSINYKSIKRASSSAMQPLSDDMSLFSLLTAAASGAGGWRVHTDQQLVGLRGLVWEHIMHAEGSAGLMSDSVMTEVEILITYIDFRIQVVQLTETSGKKQTGRGKMRAKTKSSSPFRIHTAN